MPHRGGFSGMQQRDANSVSQANAFRLRDNSPFTQHLQRTKFYSAFLGRIIAKRCIKVKIKAGHCI